MKKRTRLILTYIVWALLLQHHAGAGQKVFAILSGKTDRLFTLSGYLAISFVVIVAGCFLCRPSRWPTPAVIVAAFGAWLSAFLGFWCWMVHCFSNASYENPFHLFAYLVLAHILVPIAPLAVVGFTMKSEQNESMQATPNGAPDG